jgi:hypothetical protein
MLPMPTRTYGQFSAKASVRLPTDAYGTTYYRNALRYPSTMVRQSYVTPAVPRGQLPRSSSTVYRPSGPTPVSATTPNHRRSTAAAQANQPLCRQLVPMVVSSGPPIKAMPEALAKFSSQSCITEISRTASYGTTVKQPQYESPRCDEIVSSRID